jgi:hypothetical protein
VNTEFVTLSQRKQAFFKADEERLTGAQQKRIKTAFGYVNVTVGGNASGPAMVLWPSLMMQGSLLSYQYQHFASRYRMVLSIHQALVSRMLSGSQFSLKIAPRS